MINLRTDLAVDSKEAYLFNSKGSEPDGVTSSSEIKEDVVITTVIVENETGAAKLKKPIGRYVTLESKDLKTLDPSNTEKISYILRDTLVPFIDPDKREAPILVVGLGNRNITPDALGPKVISEIMVTKHLIDYIPEHTDKNLKSVCAVSPGVMGITGVETGALVSAIVKKVSPALVIAVDALASANPGRIGTTVQITDSGINPGSGVGNKREGLNMNTLGVPVIAIGVPTVVDAASIASDVINKLYERIAEDPGSDHKILDFVRGLKEGDCFFEEDENKNMMVTPKEVDNLINHISKVISNGINLAIHKDIDIEYIENFTF